MPVRFSASQVQRLGQAQPVMASATEARARLQSMAVDLVDSKGGIKSGYLKLTSAKNGELALGTRWSRSADASTQQATDMVKNLVVQAYGDNPAVMQALDTYLQASGQRLGTQSFVKLVKTLEEASGQPGSAALAGARVKTGARLNEEDVGAGMHVGHQLARAQSLLGQLPRATSLQARALLRAQVRQAMDDARPALSSAPALQGRFQQVEADAQPEIVPALPGLGTDALRGSLPLRSLLEQAVRSGSVAVADRQAVLAQLTAQERQQLMDYFDSTDMDRDLADLALHQAQDPASGAGAALQELRDCDTALRGMQGVAPSVPAQVPNAPAGILEPVRASFGRWLESMKSGRSAETVSGFTAFLQELSDAQPRIAQAQARPHESMSADQDLDGSAQLLVALLADLSDAEAAQASRLIRQLDLRGQVSLAGEVTSKAATSPPFQRYRGVQTPLADLNSRMSVLEMKAAVLELSLSARLRGHHDLRGPLATAPTLRQPLAEMSAQGKSEAWRSFAGEPVFSLTEFHATELRSKTQPSDPDAVPQWRAEKYRSSRIRSTLERLQPLEDMDSARAVQLFMHPASRDARVGDSFVYLLGSKAPALLELSRQQGRVPTDAQIWQTVLGDPVPDDLQGLGSPELGTRMVAEARRRYLTAARDVHLAAGGDEASLKAKLIADPLMLGLMQGFPLERQIELMQHPDRPMTEQDFYPSTLKVLVGSNRAETIYGQTEDIHRWTRPTRFIFEGAQAGPAVLDPNAQPWPPGVSPPPDHPVIRDLSEHVQTLTAGRPAQTQAVLSALTQASTTVFRAAAEAHPGDLVTAAIEHGAFDFRLSTQADGSVQICIKPNAPLRFDGELTLVVSPQGDIRTTGLRVLARAISPARWPQVQAQIQELQARLNDPSEQNQADVMAQLQSLSDDLNQDLVMLRAQPEGAGKVSRALMDEVREVLADVQFDMAFQLMDRNRLPPDLMAPADNPDLQDLAQARQLLEWAMAHARGIGNDELFGRARDLHAEAFPYPELRLDQMDEQDLEQDSIARMIRARAPDDSLVPGSVPGTSLKESEA